MSKVDPIVIQIRLDVQQARQAASQMGNAVQEAATRIQKGVTQAAAQAAKAALAEKQAMEAQAARLSLSRAEQLIERRKQYTISAIGDEDKRLRAQIEARYTAELSAVRRLLEVRKSAGEITARQYLDELRRFEAQLSKVRDANLGRVGGASSTAFKQVDATASQANQAIQQFGFLVNDAQQAQYGFRQAVVATSNNLPIFLAQLGQISKTAKAGGTTLTSTLVKSFTGIGGLIAVLNIAATAFVLFGNRGEDSLDKVGDAADKNLEKVRAAFDAVLRLQGTDFETGVSFESEADLRRAGQFAESQRDSSEERLNALNEEIRDQERLIELLRDSQKIGGGRRAVGAGASDKIAEQVRQLELLKVRVGQAQSEFDQASTAASTFVEQLDELNARQLARDFQIAAGGRAVEDVQAALAAEREGVKGFKKIAKDKADIARDVLDLVAQADIDRIADAQARELAALDRTYQETIANANRVGAETAAIDEVYQRQRTEIQARYVAEVIEKRVQLEDAQAALIERRAELEGQTEQAMLHARIDRTRQLLAIEQLSAEQRLELEERLEGEVLDLDESRLRSAQRVAELRADADALGGRRSLAALRARHDAELDAVENAAERQRVEAVQQFEQRTVEIEQARQQEAERLRASIEGELELRQALYNNDLAAKLDVRGGQARSRAPDDRDCASRERASHRRSRALCRPRAHDRG